jgi:hypothetical protein
MTWRRADWILAVTSVHTGSDGAFTALDGLTNGLRGKQNAENVQEI